MKRRIRRIRRALKRAGLYNAFHITLIAVLLIGFCVILFNVKEPEQQEEKPETTQAEVIQNPETMTQTAESIEDKYKVFDTMSEDWGSDDLEGFVFYDLPEKYADKGYFPEKMQIYTRCLCKQNDVPYALVLAIIEYESGYEFDKTGDNGNSKGYMQIYEKWHTDRMQKLNCIDLMNPYQNVKVGIDFLSYLLKKYGTVQDALAAYNYGERGAREHLWNNGVYVYSYNTAIMQRILQEIGITGAMFDELKEIIEEMRKGVPLGYFTSQWFGNFYLKALDHYIKEELHAEHYMRYMDDMVILGKSKKKLHKIHAAIETYLNDNLDLEIKGDWQVFRFEYPVFDKGGNPVLDKDGKQVTKGRMLDFMGFQFHHDRTTIRKSNIEAARRKANHISKQDKISWYNASVMLSYMGLFKHTDTYNYYIDYIKPKINVKKLKRIVSKHSRKENEHDRLEKGDRNTAGQAGGGRQDIVAVNGLPA